ncbi:MAG: sulfotransferase domain-containing protein [Desulfuromonadaceae bacterium]
MRIIVAEYPKSGGTWMCSLLSELFQVVKRDIYVNANDKPAPHILVHPWYRGADDFGLTPSCVIKSHERFRSPLHNFEHQAIHLIRDGRDVIVSKYFYEKDFCVLNEVYDKFDVPFIKYILKIATEWSEYIHSWRGQKVITCRYEDLINNPMATLSNLTESLGYSFNTEALEQSIEKSSLSNMRNSLAMYKGDFVRKGIVGDWKNHFDEIGKSIFKKNAGDILIKLGYEHDNNW